MNREIFSRCALFDTLAKEQTALLLGCLACELTVLGGGGRLYLTADAIALLCSGQARVSRPEGYYTAGAGELCFGAAELCCACPSEVLLFSRARLCSLCKNACSFHRAALQNLCMLSSLYNK